MSALAMITTHLAQLEMHPVVLVAELGRIEIRRLRSL